MSWGRDLWDQGDNIAAHTKKGIEFLDRYSGFVTERYKIENEYARQLKTLASKYMPKKRDAEDEQFTHRQAFIGALSELGDLANQHERVAEQFKDVVVAEIGRISTKLRDDRKKNMDDAIRLQTQMDAAIDVMQKARKEYNRAHKDSEAALAKFSRVESDMNLSRAEVEKAKNNMIAKTSQAEDAKNNYALQLQKTNEYQREFFTRLLPNVFEKLREMDEHRINEISRLMSHCVDIEKSVLPIIQRCLDGMLDHSRSMNASADSQTVILRYKTGYSIPDDFPFEDLSEGSSTGSGGTTDGNANNGHSTTNGGGSNGNGLATNQQYQTPTSPGSGGPGGRRAQERKQSAGGSSGGTQLSRNHSTKRGKFPSFFKSKPDPEYVKEDFSDLPPQQQCIRLEKKMEEIQKKLDNKIAQQDGLIKMQNVYRESPKLGDLAQVEVELHKFEVEVAALKAERDKFKRYLDEANTHLNVPINQALGGGGSSNGTSPSSTPRSSVRGPPPNRPPPPTTSPPSSVVQTSAGLAPPVMNGIVGKRNSGSSETSYVARSGSDHSMATAATGGSNGGLDTVGKGKSRTPTPTQPASTAAASANGSSSTPRANILSFKGATTKPSSSASSNRLAPAAPGDDYDEWTPTSGGNGSGGGGGDAYESTPGNSSPVVILGTCKALYDFSGDGDGMMAMKEGDEMLLLERDAGDGWTKIRKDNQIEGFVPSSYLECKWYPE